MKRLSLLAAALLCLGTAAYAQQAPGYGIKCLRDVNTTR